MCDGQERGGPGRDGGGGRLGVEVQRDRVDVREHRPGPLVDDRVGRGHEGEGAGDHLVPVGHPHRAQRQVQARRAARDGARVRRAQARGEGLLELREPRAERELAGAQDLQHPALLLGAEDRARELDGLRAHETARVALAGWGRPCCIPYSSESTSACQDASITFSETPIVPQDVLAVGGVDQHPGDRAGALGLVEDADLEVRPARCRAGAGRSRRAPCAARGRARAPGRCPPRVRT